MLEMANKAERVARQKPTKDITEKALQSLGRKVHRNQPQMSSIGGPR